MKIALVLTVKNEMRILRNNLLYHKAIGVDIAFVYFDNTTDTGRESISDLEFVECNKSISATKYSEHRYLVKFTSQAAEHHTARQCLNTYDAQQKCKEAGIDWLISIDADELICTDFHNPSNLKTFFSSIEGSVEVVTFKTLESLQTKMQYENVFSNETLFKANPKAYSRYFYNPFTNSKVKFSWWYGQTMGKAAFKASKSIIPHNVHRYKKIDGVKPITLNRGFVLHYHAYDAEDFIKKFTNFSNHPNTFLSGNKVENIKLLLRDIVNSKDYTKEQLKDYFRKNILFSNDDLRKFSKGLKYLFFKVKPTPLQEIKSVSKIFNDKII